MKPAGSLPLTLMAIIGRMTPALINKRVLPTAYKLHWKDRDQETADTYGFSSLIRFRQEMHANSRLGLLPRQWSVARKSVLNLMIGSFLAKTSCRRAASVISLPCHCNAV